MNMFTHISLPLFLILSSCGLFDADPKPLEPIENFFYAEINGEPFNANRLGAGVETFRGRSFLEFSVKHNSEELFPYAEGFGISLIFNEDITMYPLHIDSALSEELGFNIPGASYSEADGDVTISYFKTPENSEGFVSIELEELEDGRKTISGTFEMTVYLSFRIDTACPQQEQDTLHITNGRYLMELNDRRE